jgi:3-oxoacyl-(acyl-carrier-protein) synthase
MQTAESPPAIIGGRHMAEAARIVVTGIGAVCAAGREIQDIWEALCAGRSAIAPIRQWDASRWPVPGAGEITGVDARTLVEDRKLHKLVRRTDLFGLYAGGRAIESSGMLAYRRTLQPAATAASTIGRASLRLRWRAYQNQYDFFPLLTAAAGDLGAFGRELAQR